jgi:predicted nucleotide-binding protein
LKSDFAVVLADQIMSILAPRTSQSVSVVKQDVTRIVPEGSRVFIIHGHDTVNTLRLRTLLKEHYGLAPVILSEQPSKGRSLIEKFKSEARNISYAFALLTSDDFVSNANHLYAQARPNVLFEIGWFYGRLGRDRVTILFEKGTSVPSDLDGILRIQFNESIEENLKEIENELRAAGLLPDRNPNFG